MTILAFVVVRIVPMACQVGAATDFKPVLLRLELPVLDDARRRHLLRSWYKFSGAASSCKVFAAFILTSASLLASSDEDRGDRWPRALLPQGLASSLMAALDMRLSPALMAVQRGLVAAIYIGADSA